MNLIQIATPVHFHKGCLDRIGFNRNYLYVALRLHNTFEVWKVHCFTPHSWCKLYSMHASELFYTFFTISVSDNCIYALVIALLDPNKVCEVVVLKINPEMTNGRVSNSYTLCQECSLIFEEIALESIGLGCGEKKGIYIFDRSMVKYSIPFWRVRLNDSNATFSIEKNYILSECERMVCTRFPIVINGDQRIVLKLTNNNEVALYQGNKDEWRVLCPDSNTDLDLSLIETRGISETFGHDWHRFGAIQSPLMVFSENECCIFKVYKGGLHTFYNFTFSEEENKYCLRRCSSARIEALLQTFFYLHCSEDSRRIAFVNKYAVAFVNVQPLTLREIGFWALQRNFFATRDAHGVWRGGKTEREVRQLCHTADGLRLL